ncbi:MAG: HEAT repeat domain-containing protein [Planctomycetota bacterium]
MDLKDASASRRVVWAVVACLGLTGGCTSWQRLTASPKTIAEQKKYGPTADQRLEEITADASRVKAGSSAEQDAFTRLLAERILAEHDPRVRCGILDVAADFDTAAAAAICRGALEDPDDRVRMAACSAWRKRGGSEAVELLAARYRADSEIDVRLRALRELGELGDKSAVPVLARALEDPDPAVQYRAVGALKHVSGRDLGDDVNKWREWAADPDGSSAEWTIAEGFRQLF